MNEPNLLLMCLNAFAAVLVLLSLLALTMRLLLAVFPQAAGQAAGNGAASGAALSPPPVDPAVAAAITNAAQAAFPGWRVSRIEDIPPER